MRPDHLAGRFQGRPNLGVHQGGRLRVGNYRESLDNCPRITFALCPVRGGSSFYSMPQFRDSNSGDFKFLACLSGQPSHKVEAAFLAFDDHIGIDDYRHRFLGGFKILRAAIRSRCQALASSCDRSIFRSASANSGPVQTFLPSGTRRATGEPFLSRTKVTF